MIKLRFSEGCEPTYATRESAGADLRAREDKTIPPGGRERVPAGVWIVGVDWDRVPAGQIPELQIRARSGLAFRHGIGLPNGVGTIDADYRDEIAVLLQNPGKDPFVIRKGDRIAQMMLNTVFRISELKAEGERSGGFGSTGIRET